MGVLLGPGQETENGWGSLALAGGARNVGRPDRHHRRCIRIARRVWIHHWFYFSAALRLLFLAGRAYEACLGAESLNRIHQYLGLSGARRKSDSLYLSATLDHEVLSERMSSWVRRRWSNFYLCLNSAVGIALTCVFVWRFQFAVTPSWKIVTGSVAVGLLLLAWFAWRDTMIMLDFQGRRLRARDGFEWDWSVLRERLDGMSVPRGQIAGIVWKSVVQFSLTEPNTVATGGRLREAFTSVRDYLESIGGKEEDFEVIISAFTRSSEALKGEAGKHAPTVLHILRSALRRSPDDVPTTSSFVIDLQPAVRAIEESQ
jgi:hypothetical protein